MASKHTALRMAGRTYKVVGVILWYVLFILPVIVIPYYLWLYFNDYGYERWVNNILQRWLSW
jgi:chromate transport protein ChrA